MNGQYAYTPHIWPSVLTVLLLIALSIYSWSRRSVPGALPFLINCLFATLMATGLLMTYLAVEPEIKIFWFRFETSWWLPTSTAITCFVLEYAWPGRWLTRRNLILLSIFPLFGIFYFFTVGNFIGAAPDFTVGETVTARLGPVSQIFVVYFFALTLVNLIVFAWLFIRSPRHRWPVVLMAASQLAARVVLLEESPSMAAPFFGIPIFALPFLTYAIALFGFRIFDPIPLARQTAIDQLNAGMLVLDPQERVVSLNPAAERILQVSASHARGRPVREMLPAYPDGSHAHPLGAEIEFDLGSGTELRSYTLATSLLKDFRGLEAGRLLLFRDVTEQKRAQAQILEQQRVLATIKERERLARELHDSLGQTLAAAHLQASTARLLLAQGETTETDKCLEQVTEITVAAEADVREYLLGAKTAFSTDLPFLSALRKYVERFSQQYSLQVELSLPPQLEAQSLGPAVEVQLLRIIQEALSNVRKHARAKKAQVVFAVSDSRVQIAINDDGRGFDPAAATGQVESFGLQAMRDRAETLGGSLEVISQPGQGTRVVVQVQVKKEERSAEKEMGR